MTSDLAEGHSYRTFLIVWFGQTISLVGSGLTWFGVTAWVFLETGSVTALSMLLLAAVVPRSLLAPFAGAYVDRWDRRTAMLVSDAGVGLSTAAIAGLFVLDVASAPALFAAILVGSAFEAFQWPAYQAATTLLVPSSQYSRAQGLMQVGGAASQFIAPAVAGFVLAAWGITVVIAIDVLTFMVAVATLLVVRFPRPPRSDEGKAADGRSVLGDAAFGFSYIRKRPGWKGLLGYQFGQNVALGFVIVIGTSYILTIADERTLGVVTSIAAIGFLGGSGLMTAWRGARTRRVALVLGATFAMGVSIAFMGVAPTIALYTACGFGAYFAGALQNATYRALWQAKVEPDVQGRVFAARMMVVLLAMPVAYALAGPLATLVFEPLAETSLAIRLFGEGEGAAFQLFIVAAGLLAVGSAVGGWLYTPLRELETTIPDYDRVVDGDATQPAPS